MKTHLPIFEYAPWSPSKIDTAAKCGKAFEYRYIIKPEGALPKGSAARVGTTVHRIQELAIRGTEIKVAADTAIAEDSELTNIETQDVLSFLPSVEAFTKKLKIFSGKHSVKEVLTELKLGMTADFIPCDYDAPNALIRGIIDVCIVLEDGHVVIIDHKSGKLKPISAFNKQLNIYTLLTYAKYQETTGLQCAINFMAHDKIDWGEPRKPGYVTKVLQPWFMTYLNTQVQRLKGFEARVSPLCGWCDYRDICPEWGTYAKERNVA